MGAFDRPFDALHADPHAVFQAPVRIYLPAFDEADQLDEPPAWRARREAADDVEYVRVDLAAVGTRGTQSVAGPEDAPPLSANARTGASIVAQWCAGWGDERPSRSVQRAMAEDIDRAIAAAVEAVPPRRRPGPARRGSMAQQLPLELADADPQAPAGLATPSTASKAASDGVRVVSLRVEAPPPGCTPLSEPPGWARLDTFRAVLWSSANVEALARLAAPSAGLPVTLYPEPSNPVDPEAIALAVEASDELVGGLGVEGAPLLRVIGYVARAEARKAALFAALVNGQGPARATLHLEPEGWHVHRVRV